MFPSPCGVMVVKHSSFISLPPALSRVSVPLRGNGRETLKIHLWIARICCVSVPLRGNGRETVFSTYSCFNKSRRRVSVPLRGNGRETRAPSLKYKLQPQHLVSVPLRGNGRETTGLLSQHPAASSTVSVPLRGNGRETQF